jgi:DNA-binding CsgD family transcriptional regulator
VFQRVVDTLTGGLSALSAFRTARLSIAELEKVLAAAPFPVFLQSNTGRLMFTNDLAKSVFPNRPPWLHLAHLNRFQMPSFVQRVPVRVDGSTVFLLIVDAPDDDPLAAPSTPWARFWGLPPRHARVAACVIKGMSNDETGALLRLEVSSVRTYLKHVFRRAGVHSRAELIRAALAVSYRGQLS